MINRKTMSLLVSVLGIHSAIAGTMGPVQENYNGFYIGGNVGLSDLNVKQFALANSPLKPETHYLGNLGFVGGGVLGYDYSISDQFKLGIEGFIDGNTMEVKAIHDFNNTRFRAKSQYNAGVRILPGYEFVRGTNGHVILGYSNAKYELRDNGAYGFLADSFNRSGFQAGLGMTSSLTTNLLVRLDAIYTTYGKQHSRGVQYIAVNGPAGPGTGVGSANGLLNPYANTFQTLQGNLTVIYKFV